MSQRKLSYSFAPGMKKVEIGRANCVKNRLMDTLGVKNRHYFCRKKAGIIDIAKPLYDEITAIFAEEGIGESEVWQITDCSKN